MIAQEKGAHHCEHILPVFFPFHFFVKLWVVEKGVELSFPLSSPHHCHLSSSPSSLLLLLQFSISSVASTLSNLFFLSPSLPLSRSREFYASPVSPFFLPFRWLKHFHISPPHSFLFPHWKRASTPIEAKQLVLIAPLTFLGTFSTEMSIGLRCYPSLLFILTGSTG